LLATTAAIAATGVALGAPNLVSDPSFENTTLNDDPWSPSSPSGDFVTFGPAFAHSGSYALEGVRVGSQAFVSQTINLQPGIYQVSLFEGHNSGTPNEYSASLGGATVIDVVDSASTTGYTERSGIVAAVGGPTVLSLGIQQNPGFGLIDDVSVVEVDDGLGNNIAAASQTVASQMSREFMDRVFDRFGHSGSPTELASGGEVMVASADGMTYVNGPGNYRAFISFYGDHAEWDQGDVHARRYGLMIGAEWAPCPDFDLGITFAAGRSFFKTETAFTLNHGDAEERAGAIYANWSPMHSSFYVSGIAGYGSSSNDFTRDNSFGQVFADGVDATQWFGGVEAGFDMWKWSRTTLTPFVRVDGARIEQDGYEEQVGGGMLVPAVVDGKDQSTGRTLLGLRATTELSVTPRPWQVSAKAAWQHEFDRDRSVDFAETSGGVTFFGVASGAVPVQDSAAVGLSVDAPLDDHASLYLGYNGNFGDGQTIHAGEAGFRVTW
jgi:outer membrane autotransporter protein